MDKVLNVARIVAILLSGLIALFSLSLLILGMPGIQVEEVPIGSPEPYGPASIVYHPYPAAILPLTAAIVIITGIFTRGLLAAWIGFAFLLEFSILFVFSADGGLLPIDFLLLILLIVITIMSRRPS